MRVLFFFTLLYCSCTAVKHKDEKGSFGYDLAFLSARDSVIVLSSGDSKVIVSPRYQGKVFTSTNDGNSSFGWINYKAFSGVPDPHMNAYGGENRLWLGPEGGRFSLFFPKDARMEFENWKTPAAFDTEPWDVISHSTESVSMKKAMTLVNYSGTALSIEVNRKVSILDEASICAKLGIDIQHSVKAVGYETSNILVNTGQFSWTDTTGMPCLWVLDMMKPSAQTTIAVPYNADPKPATTDYFGEIPSDRIRYRNNVLFFKADGKSRGKLGIHPGAARNIACSYDAEKNILTLTVFDIDPKAPYLNQEWNTTKPPFSGDAVNAYNDGPLADGKQMGPFFEIESVSPAASLEPGASLKHDHAVFHFTGSENSLEMIAQKTLGVSLRNIKSIFK